MKTPACHHLALQVYDLDKVTSFYQNILQLIPCKTHYADNGQKRSVWLDCKPLILMLEQSKPPIIQKQTSGWPLFALSIKVAEREEWKKHLFENGIAITTESPYSIYFFDPEGNRLALSHYPDRV